MFISKIPAGSKIELQCSVAGRDPVMFQTEASFGQMSKEKIHTLYCLPVTAGGKLVKLSDCNIKASILNKGDHRRYLFDIDSTFHVKNPHTDGYLTVVTSSEDAKPLNYRRAPRMECSVPAKFHIAGHVDDIDCNTYDISTCGFAVIVPKSENPLIGLPVSVVFYIQEFGWKFTLDGVIARLQDVSDTMILVGCDLTDYYPNLVALCNHLRNNQKTKYKR